MNTQPENGEYTALEAAMPCCLSFASMDMPVHWTKLDIADVRQLCYDADRLRHCDKDRGERLFGIVMCILIEKPCGRILERLVDTATWLSDTIIITSGSSPRHLHH